MKNKAVLLGAPALGLGLVMLGTAPAMAAHAEGSYSTMLDEINNSGASGEVWIDVEGTTATVTLNATGLAAEFDGAPYPHVQHIHIDAQGLCPSPDADTNGDGIISTTEGAPFYGGIGTTLSVGDADKSPDGGLDLAAAPAGDTISYEETFELDQATQDALAAGTAVVVVHGLDPATQPEAGTSESDLVPELPLAATSPALCGALAMAPAGGVDTGVEQGTDGSAMAVTALGGLLAVGTVAGVVMLRRRAITND
ncbi:hypothetical protein [Agrococcus sp. BE272]|uniref:hypothetical protein n=1 Tax=Agrococcus sp. BE272 TaxID=2817727 RepID=UPI002855D1D2|nr:hypothetical protein [Agrococcus sp. BE272]MDR7233138.1 hypothetical protein [Agrococcus sp. BE272]